MKSDKIILAVSIVFLMMLFPSKVYCQFFPSGGFQGGAHGSGGIVTGNGEIIQPSEELNLTTYPNPFSDNTIVKFELSDNSRVKLDVYDVTNRKVKTLLQQKHLESGEHQIRWNGKNQNGHKVPKGIYYYRLEMNKIIINRKIIRL